jgi:methionyl-tRNA synthetase
VLHDVCSTCIEAFRLLTIYLKPVLPALAEKVEAFLQVAPMSFEDIGRALGAHSIGAYQHLMQRVDAQLLDELLAPPPAPKVVPGGEELAPRSRSTTSARSTCASPRSSRPSLWRAATSCCA